MKILDYEIRDHEVFAVSQVRFKKNGKTLESCSATGFFYEQDDKLYFITNQHVVIDEEKCFVPDEIILNLHKKIGNSVGFPIKLYDSSRKPLWLEHPTYHNDVDVVAIPVDKNRMTEFHIESFSKDFCLPRNRYVSIGDDLLVVGYPLGIYDSAHNTPIIRSAIMASVYPLPFKGKCCFLIDSCLHNGTSGSPVLLKPSVVVRYNSGHADVIMDRHESFKRYLLGIHSEQFIPVDSVEYDPTNLNVIWYAKLIPEIINGG